MSTTYSEHIFINEVACVTKKNAKLSHTDKSNAMEKGISRIHVRWALRGNVDESTMITILIDPHKEPAYPGQTLEG